MRRLMHLMRLGQWYKNLLIFLPILFGQKLMACYALQKTFIGFIALCLASSAGYVFNDIIDRKRDIFHPESKKKYIARRVLRVDLAFVFASLLLLLSAIIGAMLSIEFVYFVIGLFALMQAYSFWLKKEMFVDIIAISVNFVVRAVSGAYVIVAAGEPYIWVSPWLLVCTFLLALFIAVGKRNSELIVLGKKAVKYKEVLKHYTPQLNSMLLSVSTTALLISYILYTFQSAYKGLIFTAPIAAYVIFRYIHLIYSGSRIPLNPSIAYRDERLMIGALLWVGSVACIIYFI